MTNRRGKKPNQEQATPQANGDPPGPPPAPKAPAVKNKKNNVNFPVAAKKHDEDGDFDRATLFTKTKMCKFHLLGMCAKGSGCMYAHDATSLTPLPDLFRTKLCKSLISTGQCSDPRCKYAHNKEELRSTSQLRKTKMCKFWLEGRCELAEHCSYAHDPNELNQTPPALPQQAPVQMDNGFMQQRAPHAVPKSLASGGYAAASPPKASSVQQMQQKQQGMPMPHMTQKPTSNESHGEAAREVMVIDMKTGKPVVAGTLKADGGGSIQIVPPNMGMHAVDAGTSPGWSMQKQQEEILAPDLGPLLNHVPHHLQKELHEEFSKLLNPVKIGLTTPGQGGYWPGQNGLGHFGNGLGPATSAVPNGGDHRPQPAALGQPKVERGPHSNSPLHRVGSNNIIGSPLRSPEHRPHATPEFHGANAPMDIWAGSDPMFSSELPVQLEQMSGGDWVVRNTFVDTDEPRSYPIRPVASCMGRFETLAKHGSSNSFGGDFDELQEFG